MVSVRWFEEELTGRPSCAQIVVVIFEMFLRMVKIVEGKRREIETYM